MDKYGVITELEKTGQKQKDGMGCPMPGCGEKISHVENTPMCPVHGTEPFERPPAPPPKSDKF